MKAFSARVHKCMHSDDEFQYIVYHDNLKDALAYADKNSKSSNTEYVVGLLNYRMKPKVTIDKIIF